MAFISAQCLLKRYALRCCAILLAWPSFALAVDMPPCWPSQIGGSGGNANVGVSPNGAWIWWVCDQTRYYIVTDKTISWSSLGGRFDTIDKASDEQAAAAASWKRNVTLPASDPRFARVMADMKASWQ